jgi:hypothetical protein
MEQPSKLRRRLLGCSIVLLLLLCGGTSLLLALLDQTSLAAQIYIQSINSGNSGIAEMLGDHFSEQQDLNRRFYALDIQRDLDRFRNAQITDLTTSREQTLSGQWATIVRFNYRPSGSSDPPQPAALRVKTDTWFVFTYIRAVEVASP